MADIWYQFDPAIDDDTGHNMVMCAKCKTMLVRRGAVLAGSPSAPHRWERHESGDQVWYLCPECGGSDG